MDMECLQAEENMDKKRHKFCLFIPSKFKGKKIKRKIRNQVLKECTALFCQTLGGATVTKGIGYWNSVIGTVQEDIYLVMGFGDGNFELIVPKLLKFCQKMKDNLFQDRVALEIDGALYII